MKKNIVLLLMAVAAGLSCCDDSGEKDPEAELLPEGNLELIPNNGEWDASVFVYRDLDYNDYYTRFSGWTGGDGVYSTLLPDNRIFWSFGDSFYGTVEPDRTRVGDKNVFVRNAVLIQDGEGFDNFTSLNEGSLTTTKTFLPYKDAKEDEHWYWPADATVHNGKLQLLMSHMEKTGSDMWAFRHASTDLAIYSLPDFALEKVIHDKYVGETMVGAALLEADGYTYIYNTSHGFLTTDVQVARVQGGNLEATWQYWNGTTWGSQPNNYAIYKDASDMFSVFKEGDKYYLLTQEVNLGRKLFIAESGSPTGPFTNRKTLYSIPREHGSGDMFSYNAVAHPELSRNSELMISYSINTHDFFSNFGSPGSADRYRPYFIRIKNWK
jgi:hypothetical protein